MPDDFTSFFLGVSATIAGGVAFGVSAAMNWLGAASTVTDATGCVGAAVIAVEQLLLPPRVSANATPPIVRRPSAPMISGSLLRRAGMSS